MHLPYLKMKYFSKIKKYPLVKNIKDVANDNKNF